MKEDINVNAVFWYLATQCMAELRRQEEEEYSMTENGLHSLTISEYFECSFPRELIVRGISFLPSKTTAIDAEGSTDPLKLYLKCQEVTVKSKIFFHGGLWRVKKW